MRIRAALIAYIGIVGFMALAGAVLAWSDTRGRLSAVEDARRIVSALGPAVRFTEALALERGVYNQVLIVKDLNPFQADRAVADRVADTDALFSRAADAARDLPQPVAVDFGELIAQARDVVVRARIPADAVRAAGGISQEEAVRLVSEYRRAAATVGRAVDLAERAIPRRFGLAAMLEISNLSNRLRELAGERSTMLSRYVASPRRFVSDELFAASLLSGSIEATLKMLEHLAAQFPEPGIKAGMAKLRATFVAEGEPVYQRMYRAAREGSPPGLSFMEWRDWTVAMLGNTLAARDAPIADALTDLARRQREAGLRFGMALVSLAAVALFVLIGGLLLTTRVLGPIGRLTDAIGRVTAGGDGDGPRPEIEGLCGRYGARRDEIGSLARALAVFERRTEETQRLNRRLDVMFDNLPQGVCFYDADGVLVSCNRRYAEMYGLDPDLLRPGTTLERILAMRVANGIVSDPNYPAAMREMADGVLGGNGLLRKVVELSDGRVIAMLANPVPGGGWLSTHMDVTERAKAEARIAHMASHDALTGLPNRASLYREIGRMLARRARDGAPLAIMCIDLDRFKAVNDTLGHGVGDELLRQAAQRLSECVRPGDVVARQGGDEFAVVLGLADDHLLAAVAQRIVERLSEPYDIEGHRALIGASVGIALAGATEDGAGLLKDADLALYRAKAEGRGRYRFFETEMDLKMQERRCTELDLRDAVRNGEFELRYQPIVDLGSERIASFEALIRWNHPTRGMVSPNDFVPLAEETGLIDEIGAWVLDRACAEAAEWPAPVRVAVNLSPRQFRGGGLLADVRRALAASGLPARRLQLEITEQVMLDSNETTLATLHALRGLGVRISMDDFGVGYSSLSYLRKFPFDKIKIDQTFVRDLPEDADSVAIVRAVVGLAAGMGMTTTAEGVETEEQKAHLRREGCTEIQGYLVSRPVPPAEAAAMLAAEADGRDAA